MMMTQQPCSQSLTVRLWPTSFMSATYRCDGFMSSFPGALIITLPLAITQTLASYCTFPTLRRSQSSVVYVTVNNSNTQRLLRRYGPDIDYRVLRRHWWRHHVCIVANFGLNISETRPYIWMVTMDSLYKVAYCLSIAHAPDDVTWPGDVIMVTSWLFFKMLLFRQFLSELDDTLTQCSAVWYVCMFLTLADQGLMTSLMTSSFTYLCLNFIAKYLGNDARYSGMVRIDSL